MAEIKIRVIDCFVYRERGSTIEFLLLRRAPNKIYEGMWRMVSGKIENEETAWQTALRELKEELGISIEQIFVVPFVSQFYEWEYDRINSIPVFLARVTTDEIISLNHEHDAYEWLPFKEAIERLAFPTQKEGLTAANNLIQSRSGLTRLMEINFNTDQSVG